MTTSIEAYPCAIPNVSDQHFSFGAKQPATAITRATVHAGLVRVSTVVDIVHMLQYFKPSIPWKTIFDS